MPTVFFIEVLFGVHDPLTQNMSVCGGNICGYPIVKAVARPLITIQFRWDYNIENLIRQAFVHKKIKKIFLIFFTDILDSSLNMCYNGLRQ